jgi:hypothetical protein
MLTLKSASVSENRFWAGGAMTVSVLNRRADRGSEPYRRGGGGVTFWLSRPSLVPQIFSYDACQNDCSITYLALNDLLIQ